MKWKFIVFIAVFFFGDLLSTWYMLSQGWREINPLGVAGMITIKTLIVFCIYVGTPRLTAYTLFNKPYGHFLVGFCYVYLTIGGILAMINNFGVFQ